MNAVEIAAGALIGGLVGLIELAGRYRSYLRAAVLSGPGILYLAVNALASAVAVGLSVGFDWRFGFHDSASPVAVSFARVIVGGFGAMALLRSSLFTFVQGDTSVDAGPAGALKALQSAVQRSVDQVHAAALLDTDLLAGLDFERDHASLTLLCSVTLVNPEPDSAKRLGEYAADLLARTDLSNQTKLRAFAVALVEVAGIRPVEAAARRLHEQYADTDARVADAAAAKPEYASTARVQDSWDAALHMTGLAHDAVRNDEDPLDFELMRADRLTTVHPVLGATAYAKLKFAPAATLLGLSVVKHDFSAALGVRIASLLMPQLRVVAQSGVAGALTEQEPAFASWVYADALYAVARCIPDPAVALAALDASISYADRWDARTSRALLHLQAGRIDDARQDLTAALTHHSGGIQTRESGQQTIPILRPIRDLLDPTLPPALWFTLWNAAAEAWTSRQEVWESQAYIPKRAGVWPPKAPVVMERDLPEDRTAPLITLLTDLIEAIPARVRGARSRHTFYNEPASFPPEDLVVRIRASLSDSPARLSTEPRPLPDIGGILGAGPEAYFSNGDPWRPVVPVDTQPHQVQATSTA